MSARLTASAQSVTLFVNRPLLDLDPKHGMWMVYFGCLADAAATTTVSDDQFMFDAGHTSVLTVIRSTLSGLRKACDPLRIDWIPCAEAIVQPFEEAVRVELLRHANRDRV